MSDFEFGLQGGYLSGTFNLAGIANLMSRDFENIEFIDCSIVGGDFAGSSFIDCTFHNVKFEKSELMAVTFNGCSYKNIIFTHCEGDFSLSNG